jgi:hypothetical protein
MTLANEALITVAQAGAWLKLDAATITADTALLEALILSATRQVEDYCGRKFVTQTITETRIGNGRTFLSLRYWPVTDVWSITVDGISLAATAWIERLSIGRLYAAGGAWAKDSEIVIVYTAGYGTDRDVVQAAVPQAATAVKMLVAQMHENREGVKSVSIDGVGSTTYDTDAVPGWQKLVWPLKVSVLC